MKDSYVAALVEDMNGKFNLIMEMLGPIRHDIDAIKVTLDDIKADIEFHRIWLRDHEVRIAGFENAA